ncbi:hypothetical protein IMPERIA89_120100 [Imperialibacter sp. 89]|nr:hypothetical protein IMPERIA89_120100 [Imperialibacter sp. 89]
MTEAVKDALRAEKAMNAALKREKSSYKEKKQLVAPKVTVTAKKIWIWDWLTSRNSPS